MVGPPRLCHAAGVGLRLLIVDDHAGYREQAGLLLELGGFEVVGEARDGDGAVNLCAELAPDVVLLDIALPDATGFDVARRLTGQQPAPAVVLVSSRAWDDVGERATSCGARGFIPKDQVSADAVMTLLAGGP